MDHPIITQIERTGYPRIILNPKNLKIKAVYANACDACNKHEAVLEFHDTKLCEECCKEEQIKLL